MWAAAEKSDGGMDTKLGIMGLLSTAEAAATAAATAALLSIPLGWPRWCWWWWWNAWWAWAEAVVKWFWLVVELALAEWWFVLESCMLTTLSLELGGEPDEAVVALEFEVAEVLLPDSLPEGSPAKQKITKIYWNTMYGTLLVGSYQYHNRWQSVKIGKQMLWDRKSSIRAS